MNQADKNQMALILRIQELEEHLAKALTVCAEHGIHGESDLDEAADAIDWHGPEASQ